MRRIRVVSIVLAVGLLAAGCTGSNGPTPPVASSAAASSASTERSPAQVLAAARGSFDAAAAVHLTGPVRQLGARYQVDVRIRGARATATLDVEQLGRVQLRVIGADSWLRGDRDFWSAAGGPVEEYLGRWLPVEPGSRDLADFVTLTRRATWADRLFTAGGPLTLVAGRPVAGTPTVGVAGVGPDGAGTLFVAATGTPYPLALDSAEGTVRLGGWDDPLDVRPPTGDQLAAG